MLADVYVLDANVWIGTRSASEWRAVSREVGAPFHQHRRIIETEGRVWDDAAFLYRAIQAQTKHAVAKALASFRNDLSLEASLERLRSNLAMILSEIR